MNPVMIEGIDYCFIYPKDEKERVHIKLLSGAYINVIFRYGGVKVEEKNEQGHLLFNYYVIESPDVKPELLEKDDEFKNYIGNLLVEIMTANIDNEEGLIDETRTDDIKESDL